MNRRPAEPPPLSRATGALARSPSEQLEPTRPLARSRSRSRRRVSYSAEPGRSSGLFRFVSGVFTLLLLMMAVVGAVAMALHTWVNAPGPLATAKAVVIPKGEGVIEIAARLERDGVISDRRLFMAGYYMAKATSIGESARRLQLKAGDYQIPQAASIRAVIDILSDGKTITQRVTVPEGLTSHQIVERLKADPSLTGDIAEVPPEGSMLPETFVVQRGASRQSIVDKMRDESRRLMERLWDQRQKGLPFKTWEEALVLASIVEKETGRNDERERVAAVFVNRLRQNMRLQSDPTILYGISGGKTVWSRPIMRSEIAQRTAHNTYQLDGLPPTPICNPGRAAIEAVLNPASTKDLFFVADGNGGHLFSETLKDHNSNVQKWRVLEKESREKEAKEKEAREKEGKDAKDKESKDKESKDKESKDKDAKDRDAKDRDAKDKGSKARTAAPAPSPPASKAPEKASPAKAPEKAPEKTSPDKASKGVATPAPPAAAKPAPTRKEGSWASTTEPAQPNKNLP